MFQTINVDLSFRMTTQLSADVALLLLLAVAR